MLELGNFKVRSVSILGIGQDNDATLDGKPEARYYYELWGDYPVLVLHSNGSSTG